MHAPVLNRFRSIFCHLLRNAAVERCLRRCFFSVKPQRRKRRSTQEKQHSTALRCNAAFRAIFLGYVLLLPWCNPAFAQSAPESDSTAEVTLTTPRSIGWFLGDELDVTAQVALPRGYTLEPASLPHPGPLNYWLELRGISHQSRHKGDQELWQFNSRYQTFYVPLEARQRRIPGFTLRFSKDGEMRDVAVPGWTFTMSPLRQIAQQGGALGMQPDAPIRPVRVQPAGVITALVATLLFALALTRHYARWPFHQRPARPFSKAYHLLRRQFKHGGEIAQALIVLHRAFDAAAGQRLLAGDVTAFIAARPHLATCQPRIEHFFAASRGEFFGDTHTPMMLPELIELAQTLARHERQNEVRA